jgi:hypothetical protein
MCAGEADVKIDIAGRTTVAEVADQGNSTSYIPNT